LLLEANILAFDVGFACEDVVVGEFKRGGIDGKDLIKSNK